MHPGQANPIPPIPRIKRQRRYDAIVIGGGAAGLFCAIEAGKRGRKVIVVEHSDKVGKKIAISGGGRCNFTNIHTTAESFLSSNPHFCKSALARYTPNDFVALIERHAIAYHEKKLGQLFCDGSSRQIIDMLLIEAGNAGVEILCGCKVLQISKDVLFRIKTEQGTLDASAVVIATGGLSIPSLGATGFGYQIARQFELQIQEPRPGLVPLTLDAEVQGRLAKLSGISVDASVSCGGREFRENILLTHRGLSGPAMLQASSYWKPGMRLVINLLPEEDLTQIWTANRGSEIELISLLSRYLSRRFARAWCELYAPSKPLKQYHVRFF